MDDPATLNGDTAMPEPEPEPDDAGGATARTFAIMAGELEDLATTLTKRQSALAKELADVEAELHRVEGVRAAMFGRPVRTKARQARDGESSSGYKPSPETQGRIDRVTAWARERGEPFSGGEAAEILGVNAQGIGPILAGMARRGELTVTGEGKARRYSAA